MEKNLLFFALICISSAPSAAEQTFHTTHNARETQKILLENKHRKMDEISPAYNNDEYNALFGAAPAARSAKPTTSLSTTTTTPVPAKEEKKVLPFQEPVKADDKDFPVFDDGELLLDDEPLDDEEFYDEEF